MSQDILVYCLACGAPMIRRPDPEGTPGGYPAFQWYTLGGSDAPNCPGCGAITSLLTTGERPATDQRQAIIAAGPVDPAAVADLARAAHFLCAAVRCHYDPWETERAGYLDAGLQALRGVGWDPDRAQPWKTDQAKGAPAGGDLRGPLGDQAPVVALDGEFYGADDLTPTGLTGKELSARIADHIAAELGVTPAGGRLTDQAPAMLALLRRLLTLYDGRQLSPPQYFADYWQDVRAVIRKAEGAADG